MAEESYTRLEAGFIRKNRRKIVYICPYVDHRDFLRLSQEISSPIKLSGQLDRCPICGKELIVPEKESIKNMERLQAKFEQVRLQAKAEKKLQAKAKKEPLHPKAEQERLQAKSELDADEIATMTELDADEIATKSEQDSDEIAQRPPVLAQRPPVLARRREERLQAKSELDADEIATKSEQDWLESMTELDADEIATKSEQDAAKIARQKVIAAERRQTQAQWDAAKLTRQSYNDQISIDPMAVPKGVTSFILASAIVGSVVLIAFGADQESESLIFSGIAALAFWSLAGCFFWILFAIEKNTRAK